MKEERFSIDAARLTIWLACAMAEVVGSFLPPKKLLLQPGLIGALGGAVPTYIGELVKLYLLSALLVRVQAECCLEASMYKNIVHEFLKVKVVVIPEASPEDRQVHTSHYSGTKVLWRIFIACCTWEICYTTGCSSSAVPYLCWTFALWDLYEGLMAGCELMKITWEENFLRQKMAQLKEEANTLVYTFNCFLADHEDVDLPMLEYPWN